MKTIGLGRRIKKAFTLVELLVVIAIIGILAGLVLPKVTDAMFGARVMEASVRAKNIVQSIFAKDAGSIYVSTAASWPKKGGSMNIATWTFGNSTEFFRELVTNGTMSVNIQFFALAGVPSAATADGFQPENNSFVMVGNISDSYPETAPAVFTRNLDLATKLNDTISSGQDVKFNDAMKPFGAKGFAFATKGGSAYGLKSVDELKLTVFTNIFVVLDSRGTALTNELLRPGPSY